MQNTIGWILIVGGIIIFGFFAFNYETTIQPDSYEEPMYAGATYPMTRTVYPPRTHNLGLQQNRLIGCISGMAAAAAGLIVVAGSRQQP